MINHSPRLLAVVVPRDKDPAKSSTLLSASALPENIGCLLLVRLSVSAAPESEAVIKSGVEGADGAVRSTTVDVASEVTL